MLLYAVKNLKGRDGVPFFMSVSTCKIKQKHTMNTVRYTPLLTDCFPAVTFLAERITQVDPTKSYQELNKEIDLLIGHLHTIKRLNALTCEASPLPMIYLNVINLNWGHAFLVSYAKEPECVRCPGRGTYAGKDFALPTVMQNCKYDALPLTRQCWGVLFSKPFNL